MKLAKLAQDQKDFYLFLEAITACVDICVFDYSEEVMQDSYALSEIATKRFFTDITSFGREITGFDKLTGSIPIEGIGPVGQMIDFDDFIGINYEFFIQAKDQRRSYSWSGSADGSLTDEFGKKLTLGLVYALIAPPYNIGLSESKRPYFETFLDANRQLSHRLVVENFLHYFLHTTLSEPHNHLIIYKWSDDWDDYFRSGKEWWGSFFWTVMNTSNKTISVFAASTTD